MEEDKIPKRQLCIPCGGSALEAPTQNKTKRANCHYCFTHIYIEGVEIKVEGSNSDEVKDVSTHLIAHANQISSKKKKSSSITHNIKSRVMSLFKKRVKCKRFYEAQSRTIDITGLKTGLPGKFDFDLGSFKIDTKFEDATEQLKVLDMLQFGLCNDINGISDPVQRDQQLTKIIETKTKMLEIVFSVKSGGAATQSIAPHFNYLTKTDLINLLLNFNSDAFTTPFRLEESLINYQNRIRKVSNLISEKINEIHPDYKRYVLDIFTLLKALNKISKSFTNDNYYMPWQHDSMAIDVLRFAIIEKVNELLNALGAPDKISKERFIRESYIVTETLNYPEYNRLEAMKEEAKKVSATLQEENIKPEIVTSYLEEIRKLLPHTDEQ